MPLPVKDFVRNPSWIPREYLQITKFRDFPTEYISRIREDLAKVTSDEPEVSILLSAYNEEANVVRCLDSISKMKSNYPFEVVMVNNNSSDETETALRALGVKYHDQPVQGAGPARQKGLDNAKGKYILLGDTDCLYPGSWVQKMVDALKTKGTSVVYGRYSFLSEENSGPRWQLALYEMMRDVSMEMRHFKRPFLNAYGMSMAFYKEHAEKVGFLGDNKRGFDGRVCFDLMKFGKVKRLRSYKAATWTSTRALDRDGSFMKAFWTRVLKHLSYIDDYLRPMPDHDTKTSKNTEDSLGESFKRIKKKTRLSSSSRSKVPVN